ncbi:MAG: NADH-quinone oxidoreductase subunit L [Actinomycetales bacterium]|nr:NADH-quinone oxidoreductase subunit L [Actinomycetales bacterium]
MASMPIDGVLSLAWVLIALPLVGAFVLLVCGRWTNRWGPYLGVLTVSLAGLLAIAMLLAMMALPVEERTIDVNYATWMFAGSFSADIGLQLDQLSMVFVLLITIVGALIHVYSLGYMAHDPDRRKFFGYLNLFVAAMLLLVLANNYLLLYVGWEGVGLASYLLIGFYQARHSAAAAAKKAFIINRVGDVGLSLAIMVMFVTFGSVAFNDVFAEAADANEGVLTAIGLLLLLAACGKSAQFPLQAWLLDAMEGPTPVSALIHAATMVTAGVYLIARSNAIYDRAVWAALAVVIVGIITVFMGAIIGSAKDDIKKSLAGSTMSQIGYMVMAAGLGPIGYVFAIFHLLTHGVFKAGLFLGAGSVMHGMNDNVDMRRYGALRTVMVFTFITFLFGYLAIIGIPPFAGFWSKDEIIHAAFERGPALGVAAVLAAGITGFYMTRMLIMTFFGKPRWEDGAHPHESPPVMTVPLVILAIGSFGLGMALLFWGNIESWLEPVVGIASDPLPYATWVYIAVTLAVVLIGVAIAIWTYTRKPIPILAPRGSWLTRAGRAELYGNQVNDVLVVRPSYQLARGANWFDERAVDGFVLGIAGFIGGLATRMRRTQRGFVRGYALSMVGGAVIVLIALALVRLA